ncbi:MAG: copper(I)-binding protein [Psychrobacter glaciei]|jgi:copper(I)-binding protein
MFVIVVKSVLETFMKPLLILSALLFSTLSQAQLVIDHASVRAMPPGQPNTAAFLHIKNTGENDVRLIKAESNAAKVAEFHSHTKNQQGVMNMAKQEYVDIAAGERFIFKTGGHHIMLMGLLKPLQVGESINITIEDSEGKKYPFTLPVVSVMADQEQHSDDSKHHHHH